MTGRAFSLILTLAYPASVFAALTWWNLRGLGLILCLLGVLRMILPGDGNPWLSRAAAGTLIAIGVTLITVGVEAVARAYPVIINLSLFVWFGWSLLNPPPVIERLARLREPDLPDYAVIYTRRVTWIWLMFFLGNGLAAAYTTLFSTLAVWALYNGLVAYVLMGCLFGIEYGARLWVRVRNEGQDGG